MDKISEMTNKELEEEYKSYWFLLNNEVAGGYGVKDQMMFLAIENELIERGADLVPQCPKIKFNEEEL